MSTIGFIGLGHMGHPMVENLLEAGHSVWVHDKIPEAMEALVALGAKGTATIKKLAELVDVAITSVQTGAQVSEICLSLDGLFNNAHADLLYIDCSSIDIVSVLNIHEEAHKRNIAMLDAPVSGGVKAAKAGSLTFMVGGSESNYKRALPILQDMGKKIVHAGPAGHGAAAKICNNLLLGISMIGTCEAMSLAEKLGLDQKKFYEIAAHSSGQCWSLTSNCPVPNIIENVPANELYKPGFMAKMMLKDLRLGQHAAEAVDATIPLGSVAMELYELFVSQGFGEEDFSAIIKLLQKDNDEIEEEEKLF